MSLSKDMPSAVHLKTSSADSIRLNHNDSLAAHLVPLTFILAMIGAAEEASALAGCAVAEVGARTRGCCCGR